MNKKSSSIVVTLLCAAAIAAASYYDKVNASENTDVKPQNTKTVSKQKQSSKTSKNSSSAKSESNTAAEKSSSTIAYEIPAALTDRPEQIVKHKGFTLSYNTKHNTPNWSAWKLTRKMTQGTLDRGTKFWADEQIPKAYRVDYFEYKESGYDRGHMCPAGDMKWDEQAMHDCFYMSNMCPQVPQLNSGSWKHLEESCRTWASTEGSIYIVCGPIYKKGVRHEKIGINHSIDVPEAFFKCVLSLRKGHEKAIGFKYDNTTKRQSIAKTAMSVDEVEKITGIDFFPQLDDALESKLESSFDVEAWK